MEEVLKYLLICSNTLDIQQITAALRFNLKVVVAVNENSTIDIRFNKAISKNNEKKY